MEKIISIGNISLGGTGKTPFAIMLGKFFLEKGFKVCVLSRGYKGKLGYETYILSDGNKIFYSPPEAADEPYLIAQTLKNAVVITGKNRKKGFELAKSKFGSEIFILDDGFQHKKIHRDIDIVLLDYSKPLSNGLIFPLGYLREFPNALYRADILIFTKTKECKIPDEAYKYSIDKPVFFSDYKFTAIVSENRSTSVEKLGGATAVAFSGIAKNHHFFRMLSDNKIHLVQSWSFRDHHIYQEKELINILKTYKDKNVDFIITTQKDYVKIPDIYKSNMYFAQIEIKLNNEKSFFETLERSLQKELDY